MVIYFSAFALIILLYFLIYAHGDKKSNSKRILFLFLSFSLLFFIMGFRTEQVGTDTELYCTIFDNIKKMNFSNIINSMDSSILYVLYNKIVSLVSLQRNSIIISNSFLICFFSFLFIYNNSKKNVLIPVLLFMCFYHFFSAMNISRQYIAVMIVANAYYYLKNDRKKMFLLLCLSATLIHNTAIVSFVLFPLFYLKMNKKNIIFYLIIVSFLVVFLDKFLIIFSSIFTHYEIYFQNNLLNDVGQNRKIIITLIYFFFEILMIIILNSKKNIESSEKKNIYFFIVINALSIILGIVSLKIMLFSRMEIYFSIFAIIYIPYILSFFKDKILILFLFTIIMLIPMVLQLRSNNSEVLPYNNIFFSQN